VTPAWQEALKGRRAALLGEIAERQEQVRQIDAEFVRATFRVRREGAETRVGLTRAKHNPTHPALSHEDRQETA
jgi:hypothetical protein